MVKRRVAVIGAGASGLTAIKCCREQGLEPVSKHIQMWVIHNLVLCRSRPAVSLAVHVFRGYLVVFWIRPLYKMHYIAS